MKRQLTGVLVLLPILVCISFLTSCSNSSQEVGAAEVTAVINEEDYTRYAVNSLDAYKIACFAVLNNDWIIAAQKWTEGDVLSEQEGKLAALGLTQAMEARLHTATSSGAVYSMISVQRLEDLMVPKFCWLDFPFAASL